MRYFYDTEFIEDGSTIELVSIGIVAEDGREFYAVSTEFNASNANEWVRENVLSKLPRASHPAWKPLQQIRDEAHRFAITYHRQQRSKRMRASALDAVPGLGPARRTDLVKHFGSVKKIKEASVEEIQEVKGVGPKLAETIYQHLHQ